MPNPGRRLFSLLSLALPFLFMTPASAQVLAQMEQEFMRMAELVPRSAVRVDVEMDHEVEHTILENGKLRTGKTIKEIQKSMSGTLIDAKGHVVTVGDEILSAKRVWVSFFVKGQDQRYKARTLGYSEQANLGLVRIQGDVELNPLLLGDSDGVKPGALVMGAGFTYNLGPSPSISTGMVNATDRPFVLKPEQGITGNLIQTSLTLRPGEAGGPVINSSQEVVGLLLTPYTHAMSTQGVQKISVQLTMGATFVMPINLVKREVAWMLQNKTAGGGSDKPWLGFTGADIPDGVQVNYLFPGDPAERAGIKINDVVKQWDEFPIKDTNDLKKLISQARAGETVTLIIKRGGKEFKIELHVGRY